MKKAGVKKFIFSSTATVYGEPEVRIITTKFLTFLISNKSILIQKMPIEETFPLAPKSPYAKTKFMIEEILRDEVRGNIVW